ncbi:type III polyketide synthase [Piscicoccus intestinalis]|uniref:type III polyketide synthase n=1 Tax=Piscicoccus intestinalis TaxID=746033 RepID=UPI0009FCF8BD|nr:3-oxoacyl-[acyl-carrier-protein] synthase III C-terminal domain-containing protein [Piscicoccus intestinalis]
MPTHVLSARGVLPSHRYTQAQITAQVLSTFGASVDARFTRRLHENAGVSTRHTALALDRYGELTDFGQANDEFIAAAVQLGSQAVREAVAAAGAEPADVDVIVCATVTGLAVPSLEARIAAAVGLRPDVVRVPLVGLGCVAGAAGLARLDDYLRGRPARLGVLVTVELCSLTWQRGDSSAANLVASGLFGDGAAAVVACGEQHPAAGRTRSAPAAPALEVLDSRSILYPRSERTMGFDVGASGLRIVLDAGVPDLVRAHVGEDVDAFLAGHGLTRSDLGFYVAHPGGPKVLEALEDALGVDREALAVTWRSLDRIGNLSSASVLHVLADTLAQRPPPAGRLGLLLAMGPGFCSELVLLRALAPSVDSVDTADTPDSGHTVDSATGRETR